MPKCAGVNHADFSIDGRYLIATCEFAGALVKVDWINRKVLGYLVLSRRACPRTSASPRTARLFYVAEMHAGGVYLIDGDAFQEVGFIPTGVGTHGLYPSRDGRKLYVANRGSHRIGGPPRGKGSVTVSTSPRARSRRPGRSPVAAAPTWETSARTARPLWLSGRYDSEVYAIDTASGEVRRIPVGKEPHGLTVWPQPGRYSLGHTGNMR